MPISPVNIARRAIGAARRAAARAGCSTLRFAQLSDLPDEAFLEMAYRFLLVRPMDPSGRDNYLGLLRSGAMSREQVMQNIRESDEFRTLSARNLMESLHESRKRWVQGLPRAQRIVDLGGSVRGSSAGALLVMGYPYRFDELVIVDLPFAERNALARDGYQEAHLVEHAQGRIRYLYRSMTHLDDFADASVDLVHAGQAIEHVTEEEAQHVLRGAYRVLRPGGFLCLDTPNGRATRTLCSGFLHPEHKIEYEHAALSRMLAASGFEVIEAKGLNHVPRSIAAGRLDIPEASFNIGIFDDIENCFLLAYRCRKPEVR